MRKVDSLFTPELDKPAESRYSSARSTLFGKFYERVISKWLEEKRGYSLARRRNKATHKPRIYWREVSTDGFDFSRCEELKTKFDTSLGTLKKKSHCTPDGVFKADDGFLIWEAKNWPRWRETEDDKRQIMGILTGNPWVLARKFELDKRAYDISGFLFSWWEVKPLEAKKLIEGTISNIIGENKFEIIHTSEILEDCITYQYRWYQEVIEQERLNIAQLFDQLLGKTT